MVRAVRKVGIGPAGPRASGMHTLWYGVRGQGVSSRANVNARLDLVMLPAFVAATSVGLYSVATNVFAEHLPVRRDVRGARAAGRRRATRTAGRVKVIGSLYATLADRRPCSHWPSAC